MPLLGCGPIRLAVFKNSREARRAVAAPDARIAVAFARVVGASTVEAECGRGQRANDPERERERGPPLDGHGAHSRPPTQACL